MLSTIFKRFTAGLAAYAMAFTALAADPAIYVDTQNRVGIGTQTPTTELTVNGEVSISKLMTLPPQSTAPDNPSEGSIYMTTEGALKVYFGGEWRTLASATMPAAAPTELAVSANGVSSFSLTWVDNSNNENSFVISYSSDGNAPWTNLPLLPANSTAFIHSGLEPGSTYFYRVQAYNGAGGSAWTDTVSATTSLDAPLQPTDISGLTLWLDASDANSITESSGSVSQWNDKSGNAYHATQTTSSSQPTLSSGGINGLNTVSFDGVDDTLEVGSLINTHINGKAWSLFAIGNGDLVMGRSAGVPRLYFESNQASYNNLNILTYAADQTSQIIEYRYDGVNTLRMLRNGVEIANATEVVTSGFPDVKFNLGRAGNLFGNNQFGEVVFFNKDLSQSERHKIEGYLAHKWSLTDNLVGTHPYKSDVPTGASPDFDPTTVAGLKVWLDASDAQTITEAGGLVSQWADKSGNNNHATQSNSVYQLKTGEQTLNGKNVMSSSTATQFFQLPDNTVTLGSASRTVYMVAAGNRDNTTYFSFGDFATQWNFRRHTGTTTSVMQVGSTTQHIYSSIPVPAAAVIGVTNTGNMVGDHTVYVNGTAHVASGTGTFNTTQNNLYIGMGTTGGQKVCPEKIAEFLVFDRALTAQEHADIQAWLSAKWGI